MGRDNHQGGDGNLPVAEFFYFCLSRGLVSLCLHKKKTTSLSRRHGKLKYANYVNFVWFIDIFSREASAAWNSVVGLVGELLTRSIVGCGPSPLSVVGPVPTDFLSHYPRSPAF